MEQPEDELEIGTMAMIGCLAVSIGLLGVVGFGLVTILYALWPITP